MANLPTELTPLFGRTAELRQLRRHVFRDRLLTLVGPGGVGKSRLARRLAADATGSRFANQIWHINVAALDDPLRLAQTIALLLSIRRHSRQTWEHALLSALRTQQLAIVLDGCEHLLAPCAQLTELLLASCPGVHVLATSREPLGVDGEVVWRVAPLALPLASELGDQQQTRASDAVRLFVARANTRQAPFRLTAANLSHVVDICRRLGGLPLAIELAAARVPALGVQPLAARLTSRVALDLSNGPAAPPRQQSLRATLDWSYALLSQAEQLLLRRLAVFVGGWTLDAAEAVCCDDQLPRDTIASLLDQLVTASLVHHDGTLSSRFRLLELTRAYALELLEHSSDAAAVRDRLAAWLVKEVERAPPEGLDAVHAARLASEYGNVHATLIWALESGNAALGVRVATAAFPFWYYRGRYGEGQAWLEQLTASAGGRLPRTVATRARAFLALLLVLQGEHTRAAALLDVLNGKPRTTALVTDNLLRAVRGEVARQVGDLGRADALLTDALKHARAGRTHLLGFIVAQLALAKIERGQLDPARDLALELVAHARARPNPAVSARAEYVIALLAAATGQHAEALGLLETAAALQRKHDVLPELVDSQVARAHALFELGKTGPPQEALAEAAAAAHAAGDRARALQALEAIARHAVAERPHAAVRLVSATSSMRLNRGIARAPRGTRVLDGWLAATRAKLGSRAYREAWDAGQQLHEDEVLRLGQDLALTRVEAASSGPAETLTRRQQEIVTLLASGMSTGQISSRLVISLGTMRTHMDHIRRKLGVHTRAEVVAWAVRHLDGGVATRHFEARR